MSQTPDERRLGLNGRNAYITVSNTQTNTPSAAPKRDDSSYLCAKPSTSVRSQSPQLLLSETLHSPKNNNTSNIADPKSMPQENSVSGIEHPNKQNDSETERPKVQTGMDKYILVTKRKANARSPRKEPNPKISRRIDSASQNRYSILSIDDDANEEPVSASRPKPPPIYLRERTSNVLTNKLSSLLGNDQYHVVTLRRGNVLETKIQTYNETAYKKLVQVFNSENRSYYTYQLKSSKGLVVVLKGIDSTVPSDEIKDELQKKGFEVKSIINIINKDKVPQPLFKIELTYESSIIKKKGETHPIYDLRYLCQRRIRVEEPIKRKGPPQCQNCQEFGHTKAYCKLPSVCVRCGDIHKSIECPHPKTDYNIKKCSNCGENHTANYRGCRVYVHMKNAAKATRKPTYANYRPSFFPALNMDRASNDNVNLPQVLQNPQYMTYANVTRNNEAPTQLPPPPNSIEKLVETMNSFMINMQNMMQNMMTNQNMLMQLMQTVLKQK